MLRERKAVKKNNSIINNCPNNLSELLKLSAEVFMRFYKNFSFKIFDFILQNFVLFL